MHKKTKETFIATGLFLASAAIILFAPDLSLAGTGGSEFATAETRIKDIIEGSGGKILAALALGFAIVASVHKFSVTQVASAIGVGVLASVGIPAVQAGITGLI